MLLGQASSSRFHHRGWPLMVPVNFRELLIKHEAGLKEGSRRQIRLKSRPVYTKIGGSCR